MTAILGIRTQLALSLRVVRAILRSPGLRQVQIAFLVFNAVEFGTWIAILLYAYSATGPASVGLVALVQLAPAAIVAPLSANLADRYRRDRVLCAGYVVQAVAFGLTAIAMAVDVPPIVVYVGAAAAATSLTITRPTQGALLPSVSRTPEELTAANGLSGTVEGTGLMIGPLAAAAILVVATPTAVIAAGAAACLVAAALVVRLPMSAPAAMSADDASHGHDYASPQHEGLLAGISMVRQSGATRLVVGILALRLATVGATDVLFVLLALEVFDIGESGASLLSAALGLGMIAGGAVTFSLVGRQRLAPVLAVAAVLWGACLVLVGTVSPVWLAAPLIAVGGIGLCGLRRRRSDDPPAGHAGSDACPRARRARGDRPDRPCGGGGRGAGHRLARRDRAGPRGCRPAPSARHRPGLVRSAFDGPHRPGPDPSARPAAGGFAVRTSGATTA